MFVLKWLFSTPWEKESDMRVFLGFSNTYLTQVISFNHFSNRIDKIVFFKDKSWVSNKIFYKSFWIYFKYTLSWWKGCSEIPNQVGADLENALGRPHIVLDKIIDVFAKVVNLDVGTTVLNDTAPGRTTVSPGTVDHNRFVFGDFIQGRP